MAEMGHKVSSALTGGSRRPDVHPRKVAMPGCGPKPTPAIGAFKPYPAHADSDIDGERIRASSPRHAFSRSSRLRRP